MALADTKFEIPPKLISFVGPNVTREARMLAARGNLPLAPKDLVEVFYILSLEEDEEIRNTAAEGLVGMPPNILNNVVQDQNLHPLILDFISHNLPVDSPSMITIALNRSTDDETIAFMATLPHKQVLEIIGNNQIRILRYPEIVDVLADNPLTGQSVIDRILHFIHLETARHAPAGQTMEVEIEHVEHPAEEEEEPVPEGFEEEQPGEVPAVTEGMDQVDTVTMGENFVSAWVSMTFTDELLKDHNAQDDAENEVIETNLYKAIQNMKVSQKVKLALMGGKEARNLLIRDANKMVSSAVIKSPRITESEVEGYSKSRAVSDDVIRYICNNKEWLRSYQIKLNLVNNSKTPLHQSMRLMNFLRDKDVSNLARSKNIPAPVASAARKLIQKRQEKGKAKKGGH